MASTINATTSGIVTIGDSVATLSLQTGGNTAVAIDTAQIVSLSKSLALLGSTSGSVTIAAPAVAGTTTLTLPATSGTLLQSGTAVTVAQGGTGQTSYTDGQLLIGNTTGNTLSKATLTAGTNVTITNGAGAITIAASSGGGSPGGSTTQVQYNNAGAFAGSANLVFDGSNLGVSNALSTWSIFNAVQLPSTALFGYTGGAGNKQTHVGNNCYYASGGYTYTATDSASYYKQVGGQHQWFNAASGTAGAIFTPVEQLRINSNSALVLAGGAVAATGVGITFPATQSASTDVNTLDDYEEGTWTPAYGATFTGTYASNGQVGRYTKVGRFVCVYAWLQASTISGSGSLTVTGLPFAPVTATNYNPGGVIFNAGNWGTNTPFSLDGAGGTSFNMKYRATANGSIDANNSAVSDMASNCFMRVSVVYETAT